MAQTASPTPAVKSPRVLMLASIAIVIAALYFAKEVLIPIALAIMLSFLLAPLVLRLQRLKIGRFSPGRVTAVISVVLFVVAVIGVLGYVVYGQVYDLAEKIPQYKSNIQEKVRWFGKFTQGDGAFDKANKAVQETFKDASSKPTTAPQPASPNQGALSVQPNPDGTAKLVPVKPAGEPVNPIPVTIADKSAGADDASVAFKSFYASIAPVVEPLATLGLVAILMIFMLVAREDMRDRIIRLIGQGRINVTTQAMDEAAKRISKYLIAQCIVNGTYGVAIGIGLWVIGATFGGNEPSFPNFLLWGLLTAILRFIPYIGPWIGAAFPIAISLAVYHGMAVPLAVLGMFLVIELISNNVMEPWLYGSSTGISEVAILVAAVFWTWLWGTPGLLLATPLTTIIVVMGKYIPQLEFLNILLGSEPALEPKYRLYQRLLAEDAEEAEELLTEYVGERSLAKVYDEIVLPALGLAEADRHRDRLDERKQAVIRTEVRELVEEMADLPASAEGAKARPPTETPGGVAVVAAGNGNGQAKPKIVDTVCGTDDGPSTDAGAVAYERPILVIPARDEADEIAGVMLSQLLDRRGYRAEYVSVEKLASEYVQMVEEKGAQVVFVSALPPAAVTHARYIVKRLRAKLPDLKVIVGLWTLCGEDTVRKAKARIAAAGTDLTVCNLEDAIEQLRQVVAPLLIDDAKTVREAEQDDRARTQRAEPAKPDPKRDPERTGASRERSDVRGAP
ncbi:MAG: AI-2E family transporter [Phycisphaerae bacterium]|nr:AI-2E family transporter [Tepidisphaeraceae bacterium]